MPKFNQNRISLALKVEILTKVNKKARRYFKDAVEQKEHVNAEQILSKL